MDVTPAKSEHGHYRAMMTINQKSFQTKKNSPSSRSLSLLGPRSLSLSVHVAAGGTWNWILDDRQRRRRPDSELGADTARKWTATEIQFRKTPKIFWFDVLKPSSTSRGKWRIGVGSRSQGNMINFRAALLSSHPERQNFNQHRKKKPTKYCF